MVIILSYGMHLIAMARDAAVLRNHNASIKKRHKKRKNKLYESAGKDNAETHGITVRKRIIPVSK